MIGRRIGGLWAALAWVALPAVPVVLEDTYHGALHISIGNQGFPDPRVWGWFDWLTELGPLVGFGFLAGVTIALPDEPTTRRWPRSWLSRRWFWVVVGPWAGFLVGAAPFWSVVWTISLISSLFPDTTPPPTSAPAQSPPWDQTWVGTVVTWLVIAVLVTTLCYGWLVFAVAAVRRARRIGIVRESVRRGLAVAAAFVGSLFGSFWAVTEWWRDFFFDPRIVPVLLAGVGLVASSGCAAPISYGEVRRRELFHAMLLAWTFGLALLWRWWARPRPRPPHT